jgi:hypothetical protein
MIYSIISILNIKNFFENKNTEFDKENKESRKFYNENSSKLKTADTSDFNLPLLNNEDEEV